MPVNPEWLAAAQRRAAYHEAGHAVMAMAFGRYVGSVSINAEIDGGTTSIDPPPPDSELNLVRRVLLDAAGVGAEKAFCAGLKDDLEGINVGFEGDMQRASNDLQTLGQAGSFKFYTECAAEILDSQDYRAAVTFLAETILVLFSFTDQSKLSALAKHVPQLDDFVVRKCRKDADVYKRLPMV